MSWTGIWVLPAFASTCGAAFGQVLYNNQLWMDTWNESGSVPALLVSPLLVKSSLPQAVSPLLGLNSVLSPTDR
jgi:hypothetical protein